MKRIGIILVFCALWATNGIAASRVSTVSNTTRTGTATQRAKTQSVQKVKTTRIATPQQKTVSRAATTKASQNNTARTVANRNTISRAGVTERTTTETRTGTEYEQCKNAYFTCMDQFCQLKNDEYRRCSCSDRITSLQSARNNLQQAAEQLNAFNENLDIVGKTAAQAAAMNTASDGELAMAKDNSASKALLTAIMNSIRGSDSRVENNQLSSLNSIDLSFDAANSFGTRDVGQTIASYNGQALYSAVYPQCRTAVKSTCNDASLQRAINAYLMAIEQDCNTVQTAITNKQKETHAAIRESSSMLDMARAENHKNHNSDDIATCVANVESAILSEEVCGFNYHKCLDNGEYIDVTTGAPISGVVDFYKLGTLLTFTSGRSNADQKLAQNPNNRTFVTNFEKRVKQFAEPALNKCYDDADTVWSDYLNKAMLDIYYAQQSKVDEIKQGCFDFVSACYMNGSTAMTNAMQGLIAAQTTTLNPNVLKLNSSLCADYIASCNNMFDGEIVNQYINNRHKTDSLSACRAVAKQCFDNYGGQNYENFYKPSSGLFTVGHAPDWFALYECNDNNCTTKTYKSECAKQLAAIDACSDPDMVEQAFGGFNYYPSASTIYKKYAYNNKSRELRSTGIATEVYNQIIDTLQIQCSNLDGKFMNVQNLALYSDNYNKDAFCESTFHKFSGNNKSRYYNLRELYSTGKQGKTRNWTSGYDYIRVRSAITPQRKKSRDGVPTNDFTYTESFGGQTAGSATSGGTSYYVSANVTSGGKEVNDLFSWSNTPVPIPENMCPLNYGTDVDVQSWGACLCWENGGRRSNDGTSIRCSASFPVRPLTNYNVTPVTDNTYAAQQIVTHGTDNNCINENPGWTTAIDPATNLRTEYTRTLSLWNYDIGLSTTDIPTEQDWCTAEINSKNQVCPFGVKVSSGKCAQCRVGWERKPCDNGYTYNSNTEKCVNSSDSTDIKNPMCCPNGYELSNTTCTKDGDTVNAIPISSAIMDDNFPQG